MLLTLASSVLAAAPPAAPGTPAMFFGPTEKNVAGLSGTQGCCRVSCRGVAGQPGNASDTCQDVTWGTVKFLHFSSEDACRANCSADATCMAYEYGNPNLAPPTGDGGGATNCEIHTENSITTTQYYGDPADAPGLNHYYCQCYVKSLSLIHI